MLIESLQPLLLRLSSGDIQLHPGIPVELSDQDGIRLLSKVPDKVRLIHAGQSETVIEPASPSARPVYWEGGDGKLCGPATPEYLAKTGPGDHEQCWVIVTYQGTVRWLNSDRLRAKPSGKKNANG